MAEIYTYTHTHTQRNMEGPEEPCEKKKKPGQHIERCYLNKVVIIIIDSGHVRSFLGQV